MLIRHCDADGCDTFGGRTDDWLDVYAGDHLIATLCCRWCAAKWGAMAEPTTEVGR